MLRPPEDEEARPGVGEAEEGGAGLGRRLINSLWDTLSFRCLRAIKGEISSRRMGMWV